MEKLSTKHTFKNQQSFLYAVYKQAYLELLERQEYQKVCFGNLIDSNIRIGFYIPHKKAKAAGITAN